MSAVRILWGSNIQHGDYYQHYCIIYSKVAESESKRFLAHAQHIHTKGN